MDRSRAKRIVEHAVAHTKARWQAYAVRWASIDTVFIERGYEQQGFKCFRFVPFLEKQRVRSIDALGSVLPPSKIKAPYDNEYAKGIDSGFHKELGNGDFGENGRLFHVAVRQFMAAEPTSGGRFPWRYFWYMLQACSYLRQSHSSSFATYLLSEYRRVARKPSLTTADFLSVSDSDWQAFLEKARPWRNLRGVGENVFDFIMGDVEEARFARDSFKFDSANQHFLEVTGITALIEPFDRRGAMAFLRSLELPYTLREINKGIYTYCSKTEAANFGYCRSLHECRRCAVNEVCGKHFTSGRAPSLTPNGKTPTGCTSRRSTAPDRGALVAALRAFEPAKIIERYQLRDLTGKSPTELLAFTVDSTIYRAFRYETPKRRYARWRWHRKADQLVETLNALSDQASFDRLALQLGESLVADWGSTNDRGEPSRMNIGVAMKIVNLALKHLAFSEHGTNPHIVKWLHVPWDSFTLRPLRSAWRGQPAIPASPSQGFVTTRAMYEQLHATISEIAAEAGTLRIHYEIWAWDSAH